MKPDAKPSMVVMKLDRNYCPRGDFEIVGHHRPEVRRKNAAGVEVIVSPETFVEGEAAPAPRPGVAISGKIWAGTVLRLPTDEAKAVNKAKIGVPALAD